MVDSAKIWEQVFLMMGHGAAELNKSLYRVRDLVAHGDSCSGVCGALLS